MIQHMPNSVYIEAANIAYGVYRGARAELVLRREALSARERVVDKLPGIIQAPLSVLRNYTRFDLTGLSSGQGKVDQAQEMVDQAERDLFWPLSRLHGRYPVGAILEYTRPVGSGPGNIKIDYQVALNGEVFKTSREGTRFLVRQTEGDELLIGIPEDVAEDSSLLIPSRWSHLYFLSMPFGGNPEVFRLPKDHIRGQLSVHFGGGLDHARKAYFEERMEGESIEDFAMRLNKAQNLKPS